MPSAPTASLVFDDVVVDFSGRRLLRFGQPVALEPKAFEVLALLSASPGQAFTRDQILDSVWGHRHVTPGVLNRVMTLLRHALGEDAASPRYLHTLHGVGYRFDLPMSAPPVVEAPPFEPPPGAAVASQSAPPQDPAARPAPLQTVRKSLWPTVLGAVVAVVAALALGWWALDFPTYRAAGQTAARATPTLIVMPLKPIGEAGSARDIAAGLSDELITELAHIDGLRVIARESTSLVATRSSELTKPGNRLNISHLLEGSLHLSGEQMRVHLRLISILDGNTLWAQEYDRPAADLLSLQREIARAVASALALRLGLASSNATAGGDAEFLRRYFGANAQLKNPGLRSLERVDKAETQFRALARERPGDARARAGLALALSTRAFVRPALAEALRVESLQEAELALKLDPNLADAIRVQAAAACRSNDWEQCIGKHEHALRLAPSESGVPFEYALAVASLGYLDRAAAIMREGIERDPLSPSWRFGFARLLDTLGEHDLAHEQFAHSQGRSVYGRWFNAVWRADLDEAMTIARSIERDDSGGDYGRLFAPAYIATTRALSEPSEWGNALRAMDETERRSGLMNFLRVLAPGQDPAQLIRGLDEARERSYSSWDLLLWTRDLAYLRRHPSFQSYLRDNGILAYWQRHGFPPQCRGKGTAIRCD